MHKPLIIRSLPIQPAPTPCTGIGTRQKARVNKASVKVKAGSVPAAAVAKAMDGPEEAVAWVVTAKAFAIHRHNASN